MTDPEAAPAPDLLAAVEALEPREPPDGPSPWYFDGFEECQDAVLALLRSAPASREAGLDADLLARAISKRHRRSYVDMLDRLAAQEIAAEYARLATAPASREAE